MDQQTGPTPPEGGRGAGEGHPESVDAQPTPPITPPPPHQYHIVSILAGPTRIPVSLEVVEDHLAPPGRLFLLTSDMEQALRDLMAAAS